MDVRSGLRWQRTGDVGEDWCIRPTLKLGCSAEEEDHLRSMLVVTRVAI